MSNTEIPPSVTFQLSDIEQGGMGCVHCPQCDETSTWSYPDEPPQFCWDCGIEFHYSRKWGG